MRVYVAGKYNDENVIKVLANMKLGLDVSAEVLRRGHAPFCPWLDFQYGLVSSGLTVEDYKRVSMQWLDVSDAILMLPNYTQSAGALREFARAKEIGTPVFYDVDSLPEA